LREDFPNMAGGADALPKMTNLIVVVPGTAGSILHPETGGHFET